MRETGRAMRMMRRERIVMRRAQSPGPSSQSAVLPPDDSFQVGNKIKMLSNITDSVTNTSEN